MRYNLPPARAGQTVGLLGGSFDPAHIGHLHLSLQALRRFGLDHMWWMVSPQNPLKTRVPAGTQDRMMAARALLQTPRITVTNVEDHLGTQYTAETLYRLQDLYPTTRFVWVMGADNLVQIDQWHDWRGIFENFSIGVMARPKSRLLALRSKAARAFHSTRLPSHQSRALGRSATPRWCFVNMPLQHVSSTQIRAGLSAQ